MYTQLGDAESASDHRRLHAIYKADDNARDRAIALAKSKYPAANLAAEEPVIYQLHRAGAPGLDTAAKQKPSDTETGGGE